MRGNSPENDVSSVASGVRPRVLVPLFVTLVLLLLTFVSMFFREARERQAEDIARTAASVEEMFKVQSIEGVQVMRSIMELVIRDRRLEAALRARDRQTLLDISQPILKEISARNRITHFYYILPDSTMLLRVQLPDKYGDKIDRFVLREAQRTGKPFWGNEQGPFGSLTLRVTYPWYSNGEVVGYLEMGIEFEDIMQTFHKMLDVDVFVAIDKKFLDRVKWESMRSRMGGKANWDEFPSVVVLSRTSQEIPAPIAGYLAALKERHVRRSFETAWGGRVSQTVVMPFSDLRGRELGELVVLRDITSAASERRRGLIWVVTLCTVIGGGLMLLFYVLLGRVQKDVAERTARLTEAQRVLAVEQVERQRAEREVGLQQERIGLLEAKGRMVQELVQAKKALEARGDELQRVNEKLGLEVAERRQAEEEVSRLNAELEQKVAERTRQLLDAQEELVSKEKLSILGQLSGSVGHELRNPLGVMNNAVYFLKMVLAEADETVLEYLGIVEREIANSLRIITDLLDFARTRPPRRTTVTPEELVRQSLGRCSSPDDVTVTVDVPDGLPSLDIDPLQLEQVLTNFITNGLQAMPDGGALRIAARLVPGFPVPGGRAGASPQETADFVAISVADTGQGISPENMKKLFQPLFTTKPKGIGLGLVVCRNLVQANGGHIEVESEPGKGTSFTVLLPAMGTSA